ncbi:TPA: hypothetical protein ACX3EJ_001032 [Vibrio parahaemolyticus]|nr:hypothetical protein [Vibrio parahaemolyticus]HDF8527414.1 hypothetical protein [Vibrio parahaemolyticus]
MSGLARGFQIGYNMADRVAQEDENKRRYEKGQERLDAQDEENKRRWGIQNARLEAQDQRAQESHDVQMESAQHNKERRGIVESQQDQLFKTNIENARLQIKSKVRDLKQADIQDAWGIAYNEFQDTGTISQETFDKMRTYGSGTAFDINNFYDDGYIKSVDYLNDVSKNGLNTADPQKLMQSFNTVYKQDINKFKVTPDSSYNKVTNAQFNKDGSINFEVTGFDSDGNKLGSRYVGQSVPFKNLVDNAFARKTAIASVIAHPEFQAQLQYAHTKWGGNTINNAYNNVKYAQTLYRDILDDTEKNKREVRRSYQGQPMADPKKMQAELDALDEEQKQKIAQLASQFSPQELMQARIPMPSRGVGGQGGGQTSNNGQSSTDDDKRDKAMEALKKMGLLKE